MVSFELKQIPSALPSIAPLCYRGGLGTTRISEREKRWEAPKAPASFWERLPLPPTEGNAWVVGGPYWCAANLVPNSFQFVLKDTISSWFLSFSWAFPIIIKTQLQSCIWVYWYNWLFAFSNFEILCVHLNFFISAVWVKPKPSFVLVHASIFRSLKYLVTLCEPIAGSSRDSHVACAQVHTCRTNGGSIYA